MDNISVFKSPLSGVVTLLSQVPDPVFANKMVGDGLAIDPISDKLVSPCDGKVVQLHDSHHALTLETSLGVQLLIHIGVDTVKLKGEGFNPSVKVGDTVSTGDLLIEFDADYVGAHAKSLVTVVVIANGDNGRVEVASKGRIESGSEFFSFCKNSEVSTSKINTADIHRSFDIKMHLPAGLHARPSAQVALEAKKFSGEVFIKSGKNRANAKSLVDLLNLSLEQGQMFNIEAQGSQAENFIVELSHFIQNLQEDEEHEVGTEGMTTEEMATEVKASFDGKTFTGVGSSKGLRVGRIFQMDEVHFDIVENAEKPDEKTPFLSSIDEAIEELDELQKDFAKKDQRRASIFSAHKELLQDPLLLSETLKLIKKGKSAAFAWKSTVDKNREKLLKLNNQLMAMRANDLKDIGDRVLKLLLGDDSVAEIEYENAILIAKDLTPSQTAQFNPEKIVGFCTLTGGKTSHVSILARSLGIPAISGISEEALKLQNGLYAIIDGSTGELRLDPTEEEIKTVKIQQAIESEARVKALAGAKEPVKTRDGKTIEVAANIANEEDSVQAVNMGCDAVGLLRSEFLFLGKDKAPSEDEQKQIYQQIADNLKKPLTIRTLDVGGDKPLNYIKLPKEENPFLGIRGLRIGLRDEKLLREQLRAILGVRSKEEVRIMFPMVGTKKELLKAKEILQEEKKNTNSQLNVKVGIMIEVPSAAIMADQLAEHVDFFSIGTNDLSQYTLAIDRGHSQLADQLDGLHPSLLRLIKMTCDAAHKHNKWVGVCGGLASEEEALPVLVGLGVDELSLSVPLIPTIKSMIKNLSVSDCKKISETTLNFAEASEVREYLSKIQKEKA